MADIMFPTDPREVRLLPLRTRRSELFQRQVILADDGQHLSTEEQAELAGLIDEIAEVIATPHLVECHGGDCKKTMDVRTDSHVLLHCNSIKIFDATTSATRWIYPPNIGTVVMCVDCFTYAQSRFEEQRAVV